MFSHLSTRQQYGFLSIVALGLAACAYMGASRMRPIAPMALTGLYTEPPVIERPETKAEPPPAAEVVVHVAGAVKKPGVIRAKPTDRVVDAIRMAGGAKPNADLDRLNLAAKLSDGTQLYVPSREEALKPSRSVARAPRRQPPPLRSGPIKIKPFDPGPISVEYEAGSESSRLYAPKEEPRDPPKSETSAFSGKVSLNSATLAELDTLPGVGPAIAQKILDYRRAHGGFRSIEEILEVPGIGPKKFEKMRDRLRL